MKTGGGIPGTGRIAGLTGVYIIIDQILGGDILSGYQDTK